jgi:protein-disulfide isomerase
MFKNMFKKKKKKRDKKIMFVFGLMSGIVIVAIVIPIALLTIPKTTSMVQKMTNSKNKLGININDLNPEEIPTPTPVAKNQATKIGKIAGIIQNNEDAKISVEVFGDFEGLFDLRHTETFEKILTEYGKDINFEYKHFPLPYHTNAQKAAEAFECARDQNKQWEMHDKIYEANANKNMSVGMWKSAARELGLNPNQFNSCLDSNKYLSKIKQDQAEGIKRGIRGTPATFINGEMVSGAVPYDIIKKIIEKNL